MEISKYANTYSITATDKFEWQFYVRPFIKSIPDRKAIIDEYPPKRAVKISPCRGGNMLEFLDGYITDLADQLVIMQKAKERLTELKDSLSITIQL